MKAIEINKLRKNYRVYHDKAPTLKERLLFLNQHRYEMKEVIKGIDLVINKGDVVGLIGENGCGKSTLLKLMTRIIYPDSGEITTTGKVSSLLELGAGFHPDMTGRENIFINASILGLNKKQINNRLDIIIAFSELEEFIDNPVRTYSSGMYMRLAFSVAINVDADILLIDEILAVGDAGFQRKCYDKIAELKSLGKTIVIVSHDTTKLKQLCNKVYWLKDGQIDTYGNPELLIDKYIEFTFKNTRMKNTEISEYEEEIEDVKPIQESTDSKMSSEEDYSYLDDTHKKNHLEPARWGNKAIEFIKVRLLDETGKENTTFRYGDSLCIDIQYKYNVKTDDIVLGFGIFLPDGNRCYGTNTQIDNYELSFSDAKINGIQLKLKKLYLVNGIYYLNLAFHSRDGFTYDYLHRMLSINIYSDKMDIGIFKPEHKWLDYFVEEN